MKLIKEIADEITKTVENIAPSEARRIIKRNKYDVTRAIDAQAESAALKILANQKSFNLLSEETGFHDFSGSKVIVLDPVDGTFNAISGIPFYSISIAVGKRNISDIEYALVRNLVTKDDFEARKGRGALMNGKRIKTRDFELENATFSVYLGKYAGEKSYEFAKKARRIRSLSCASLEICFVACGTLDAYYQYGYPLRVTDVAAGTLILREAGGEIYDDNLNALEMDFNLNERKNVIAIGSNKVLGLIK